ncbi:DNA repair-scaffolding protein [Nematolebias whitei]|uniref:DNA repair-scaffolding protein n=1 Tax=Nematolebias whitei TaxID=451745 RepID=UPI0018983A80|nr:DNA repair-scaffolding protein [Nematolebias whitei]
MSSRKRKKYSKKDEDIQRAFFPDADDSHSLHQNVGRETSLLSSSRSWAKCGDSFLGTTVIKSLQPSRRKLSAVRRLAQTPALVQSSSSQCVEYPVHIAWSSSDTEHSDDENQEKKKSVVPQQQRWPQRPEKPTAPIQSYIRALSMLTADKEDVPVIDTDSDLHESEEDAETDSGQKISDCESNSADERTKDFPVESANDKELEITGYASDGEDVGSTFMSSKLDSESFPLQSGEGSKSSVSNWLKSAQAMLQTPQKTAERQSKTPDDSAKKKRKFKSGGLAERLNRLQCRQRSAISFWRHKSISDTSAATTTTVDRPGVLVLELLDVHEECSMQLARCKRQHPPGEGDQQDKSVPEERMLVLFNKETAAQLSPAPRDIIHIIPPWQSLSVEGFSCSVILNTHFSHKVYSASKPANSSLLRVWVSAEKQAPYYLGQIFRLLDERRTKDENSVKQITASDALCSVNGSGVMRHCISLLEAIEGLGQAGSVEQDVAVVIQRVYSIPLADSSPVSILKHRVSVRSSMAPPPAERGKTRLCILVQDSCGIFSVVQLQPLICRDKLHWFCQMWQGRTCVLKGIKVVQRVTRERHSRLFSLIDSLWPPALPPKDHGNSLSIPKESRSPAQAPSFCYLLSGQQSSVEPTEGQITSPLYLPPTNQSLRDVLQSEEKTCRISFVATVLYKRMQLQSPDVGQGEVWLVLTDPSLQEERPERPRGQTVALCVNTSCVLTSSVLKALNSPAACQLSFRDAIRENGVLLCVEQSVIEVCSVESGIETATGRNSLSQSLPEPQVKTLPQPLRLDSLSLETTPNSLCTLTGVIVGVDENTAYSWPACNLCGSDNLGLSEERPQKFHCVSCKSVLDKPDTKVQLEVFLTSSTLNNCTLKVKLQQKTILSLLNASELEVDELQGYDVESVLGKEVGPIIVYVRVVTRKPAFWMGLEEICLQGYADSNPQTLAGSRALHAGP